jgi:hypothetical protein
MSNIYFLEPSWIGTGLTNQIYFIIYGIIYCINNNKKYLVLNNFRLEPMTEKFCGISDILDIHYLNILLNKYNIIVFDRNKLNFNIDTITYGVNENVIDITEEIKQKYYSNNKLQIPVGTILNNIKGDPYPGEAKKININYKLNDIYITEEYSEYIHNDIIINLQNPEYISNWSQIDECYTQNEELFVYFLKNIKFNNRFINYSNNALLIDSNNEYAHLPLVNLKDKKVNVIHLRVEKDMTGHMLSHNKMTQEEYDINLQNKYIELIKNNFTKEDIIFVLSYDINNNVINFLRDNAYEFYISKKNIFDGREKHAIIDLLIGEKCNNIFIGNWNFDIRQGSTFSYLLHIRNNALKNIFIDMYNIQQNEVVIENNKFNKKNFEDYILYKNNYNYVVNRFKKLCNMPLDINEHLPTLYKYAKECDSILECGVRGCISSWAFTYGLIDNENKNNKKLFLNDLVECDINDLLNNTKNIGRLKIDYKWCSDLDLKIEENVDIVFIDTFHVYGQLKRELNKFSKIANKYIIMHDTNVDEIYGECIRLDWDASSLSRSTNIPVDEITKGLKFAIDEFLENNNDWVIHEIFINNNGLTILKKIENHNKKFLPISFSIPEEKICHTFDLTIKNKIEAYVKPLIDRNQSYIYNKEEDYYNDLKTSYFALTHKRNGWDCLRHYEILANNCIPYFSDIDKYPKNLLYFYPKELIKESNKLYEKVKNLDIEDFVTNYDYINTYITILKKLKEHTINNLTTKSLANYIINSSNNNPSNILVLSPNSNEDYLKCLTIHGFKKLFGSKCHDYPKIPCIYKSCNSTTLYGNGFTYSKLLDDNIYRDDNLDKTIEEDIKNKKYDIIIYPQSSINYIFYDIISNVYDSSKIIFLNGEDHVTHFHLKHFNDMICKGHFCYIREFLDFNKYDYFVQFVKYFDKIRI